MNKTYRVRRQFKIISFFLNLPLFLIMVGMLAGPGIFRDPIKWLYHTIALAGSSMWLSFLIPLIFLVVMVIVFYGAIRSSVVVDSTSITINGISHLRAKYTDITRVLYLRFPQALRVYSQMYMTGTIPLYSLEDKEELLETIKAQLGEKFVVSKKAVDLFWLSQIISSLVTMLYLLSVGVKPYGFAFAWTPVIEKSMLAFMDVKAYSLDEDGQSVWVVGENSFSDMALVMKITGRKIEHWGNLPSDYSDAQISHDLAGNPVVIKENEIIRWQNEKWEGTLLNGEQFSYPWWDRPVVQGPKFWRVVMYGEENRINLIHFDFASDQSGLLPRLSDAGGWADDLRVNADGSLLVKIRSDGSYLLYVFRDGHWMEPGYPLEKGLMPHRDPIDYCLDAEGNPWILQEFSDGYRVGRYVADGQRWDWISLNSLSTHGEEYEALQVDQRGRLWLEGRMDNGYFVRVYDVLPKGLYELEEYNDYNSNLEHDFLITLGPDGKMWVAGDNLAYIDSNAPTLPRPFPNWFAALGTIPVQFVIVILLLVSVIFMRVSQNAMPKEK